MKNSHWPESIPGLAHRGGETHFLLHEARAHQAVMAAFVKRVGEPLSHLNLLRAVAVGPKEGTGVLSLARKLGINAAAVTRLAREMEDEGLLARRQDPRDGRKSYLRLTAAGRRRLETIHENYHRFENELLAEVDPKDAEAALRSLTLIRAAAEAMTEE